MIHHAVCIGGPHHLLKVSCANSVLTVESSLERTTHTYQIRSWWGIHATRIKVWMYMNDGGAETADWMFSAEVVLSLFMAYRLGGPEAPAETGEQVLERLFGRAS